MSRHPAQITLLELIEAIEGQLARKQCLMRGGPCDGSCAVHGAWRSAEEAFLRALASATLGEVVRGDVVT